MEDRKLLVESMLKEKIKVNYQDDNEEDGPGGATVDYRLEWNPNILQRFISEGKITNLNQNSTGQVVADAFCGAGGMAIGFARVGKKVVTIDNNKKRLGMA